MKTFMIATLLINTSFATDTPKSNLMILGGGGEPVGQSTIFDNNLNLLGKYYKGQDWNQTAVAFNGGHEKTEKILDENFPSTDKKTLFTAENYNALIADYTDKIGTSIKSGEQLLVYVYTHGGQREGDQKTHAISTSGAAITNTTTLAGSDTVTLDNLEILKEKAKKNGVKLAIVDLSCHSGASLSLADDNTCVVTSTGPDHLAYASPTSFGDQFVKKMEKGKNLEEVFLAARQSSEDHGVPMISSPENFEITKNLYDALTPYLFHSNSSGDKIGRYLIDMAQSDLSCRVKRENEYHNIMSLIDQIEKVNIVQKRMLFWTIGVKTLDLSELRAGINSYKESQDRMLKSLDSMNTPDLKRIEMISFENLDPTPMSWEELIKTNYDTLIDEKMAELTDGETQNHETVRNLNWLRTLKAKQIEIISTRPELKRAVNISKDFDKEVMSTYSLAARIKSEEKKLYQSFYEHYQKTNEKKSNPCRDFVL